MNDDMTAVLQRIDRLEKEVAELRNMIGQRISTTPQPTPPRQQTAADSDIKALNDAVFAIGGQILNCKSRAEFLRIRQSYANVLAEYKNRLPEDTYRRIKVKKDEQLLGLYNKVKDSWPIDYTEHVDAKNVPLTEDTKLDYYFRRDEDAINYIADNASSIDEAKAAAVAFCHSFGGLNKDVYTRIIIDRWTERHAQG